MLNTEGVLSSFSKNINLNKVIMINSKEECNCINIEYSDEEIVDGCVNDAVITFKETCRDCGNVTYGYEISDRDGEIIDSDGGYATREEAESHAYSADNDTFFHADYLEDMIKGYD